MPAVLLCLKIDARNTRSSVIELPVLDVFLCYPVVVRNTDRYISRHVLIMMYAIVWQIITERAQVAGAINMTCRFPEV